MFLALPTQGWQFLGAPVQSCMNSAGALGALSKSFIFPRVFNVSQMSQRRLQLVIKCTTRCFAKSSEGCQDNGQGPYRENVHFHKVFKGFRPIDAVVVLLMQRPILATVAASGISMATPQKHKDFPLFLKGPPVGSSGGATTLFAPERDWCSATSWNCSFSQGF